MLGLDPVQRLKARENAAGSENPSKYAVWFTGTFFPEGLDQRRKEQAGVARE